MAKPNSKPRKTAAAKTARRKSAGPAAARPRLLVVDAEPRIQDLLKKLLGGRFDLRQATRPSDALAGLASRPADLIIADYKLPEMNGVRFLAQAGRACPGAKKLVLTGNRELKTVIAAINQARVDFFLAKPVREAELLQALEELWSLRKLERERDALHEQNVRMVAGLEQLNAELEARVRGRTRELSAANRKLKRALQDIEHRNQALLLLNESLEIQATRDPLTGLFNRREFNNRLRLEWARYKRHKRPLSLVMLDIDLFKNVNDSYGHECGDIVLHNLARVMGGQQRRQDILCRFGGEEFMIVLPETPLDAAFGVAESLRNRVAAHPFRCGRARPRVRISLGVAGAVEQNPRNEDDFIKLADLALYEAKGAGRDRSVIVDARRRGVILRMSG